MSETEQDQQVTATATDDGAPPPAVTAETPTPGQGRRRKAKATQTAEENPVTADDPFEKAKQKRREQEAMEQSGIAPKDSNYDELHAKLEAEIANNTAQRTEPTLNVDDLPNDPAALKQMLQDKFAAMQRLQKLNDSLSRVLTEQRQKVMDQGDLTKAVNRLKNQFDDGAIRPVKGLRAGDLFCWAYQFTGYNPKGNNTAGEVHSFWAERGEDGKPKTIPEFKAISVNRILSPNGEFWIAQ